MKSAMPSFRSIKIYCREILCCGLLFLSLPAAADGILRHLPSFVPTGMVSFADDSLLLWREDGRLQILDGKGEWSSVLQLPMSKVMQIRPDEMGLLALGAPETPFGTNLVLALDSAGKEIQRWSVTGAWDINITASGRRAVKHSGLLPLLPNAVVGTEEAFPTWTGDPQFPPNLLHWQDITIYCHSADLSIQHFSNARCKRPGPNGWQYEHGVSMMATVACGPWLIVHEAKQQEQLVVLDMTNGQILGRRKFSSHPHFVCAGEDQLAVGERNLELLQLPSLQASWQQSIANDRVIELIALKHYLAYRTQSGPDLLLVPRPAR